MPQAGIRTAPVSYTHLDVYKRQILNDTVMPTVTQKITEMFSYNG